MDILDPTILLKNVDLPTFGLPTTATIGKLIVSPVNGAHRDIPKQPCGAGISKHYTHNDNEPGSLPGDNVRKIMKDLGYPYVEKIGEAAFYGPKLDVQVRPAVGNEFSLSTCQIDFCLPMRFNLTYIDSDGSKKTPVVLHRAIFGSIDRTIAYYLEETRGVLPLWLAPNQINIIPVNLEYHLEYSYKLMDLLMDNGFRVSVDDRDEKLSYKMRDSQTKKIPYTLIIGDKELEDGSISYRLHGFKDTVNVNKNDFIELLKNRIKDYK